MYYFNMSNPFYKFYDEVIKHYDVLKVDTCETLEKVKTSYKKMALLTHPDRFANDEQKTEDFKKISGAYKFIDDNYDRIQQHKNDILAMIKAKEEAIRKEQEEKVRKEQEEKVRKEQEKFHQQAPVKTYTSWSYYSACQTNIPPACVYEIRIFPSQVNRSNGKEEALRQQEKLRKEQEEQQQRRKEHEEKLRKEEEEKLLKEQEEKLRKEQEEKFKMEQEEKLRKEQEEENLRKEQERLGNELRNLKENIPQKVSIKRDREETPNENFRRKSPYVYETPVYSSKLDNPGNAETIRQQAEQERAEQLAKELARQEAERVRAEQVAKELARQEAERVRAEQVAKELARQEAERVRAEQLAKELARQEAERVRAEQVAKELARQEAERVRAEQLAKELARQEAERVRAEQLAKELARQEAERVRAEQLAKELARQEAERVRAEQVLAERVRAEQAAKEAMINNYSKTDETNGGSKRASDSNMSSIQIKRQKTLSPDAQFLPISSTTLTGINEIHQNPYTFKAFFENLKQYEQATPSDELGQHISKEHLMTIFDYFNKNTKNPSFKHFGPKIATLPLNQTLVLDKKDTHLSRTVKITRSSQGVFGLFIETSGAPKPKQSDINVQFLPISSATLTGINEIHQNPYTFKAFFENLKQYEQATPSDELGQHISKEHLMTIFDYFNKNTKNPSFKHFGPKIATLPLNQTLILDKKDTHLPRTIKITRSSQGVFDLSMEYLMPEEVNSLKKTKLKK